jgi:hypothetical protein
LKKIKKIITENVDTLTIALVIVGLLLTLYLIGFKLKPEDKNLVNSLSIIGTMASFFGLAIAFIQIVALKEISVITQSTISDTKNKLMLGISISDVTEAIKLIAEIDSYIGNRKYEISRLKIIELREKLIQFKSSKDFLLIVQGNLIDEIIEQLNLQISSLYNVVFSEEEIGYNPEDVTNQLQKISTYLSDFRNKIKYQTV